MGKVIVGLVVWLILVSASHVVLTDRVFAADEYGAIAISEDADEGYGVGYASQKEAEARALAECEARAGGKSCEIAAWCQNACCALSIGKDNGWGGFWGETQAAAERAATRLCEGQTTDCKIRRSFCTSD
jgi:serine/threonine-protein kinase